HKGRLKTMKIGRLAATLLTNKWTLGEKPINSPVGGGGMQKWITKILEIIFYVIVILIIFSVNAK
ncbi:MAG: hypothetical protein LIO53_02975, partial [Oscillospiraceae bacterium]|nr:hypothetical protein [Oscillospiraceae bacterium]